MITERTLHLIFLAERRLKRSLTESEKTRFEGLNLRSEAYALAESFAKAKPKAKPVAKPKPKEVKKSED